MGKLLPKEIEPEEVTEASWFECPRCKGSGVEMTSEDDAYEVYFRFHDEVAAERFQEEAQRLIGEGEWQGHGMRRVPREDEFSRLFRPFNP